MSIADYEGMNENLQSLPVLRKTVIFPTHIFVLVFPFAANQKAKSAEDDQNDQENK